MIYYYSLGFDLTVDPFTSFSLTVERVATSGEVTITETDLATTAGVNLLTNTGQVYNLTPYNPLDSTGTIQNADWCDVSFISVLHDCLKVKTDTAGWAFHLDFSISNTTGKLTIAASDASSQFYIVPNNSQTQYILGHSTTLGGTGTASREGMYPMQFCVVPTIQWPSECSGLYEPDNMHSLAIPVSGSMPYGMSRSAPIAYSDWIHFGEPKSSIYSNTVATHPYGFDFLYAWCRQGYPFVAEGDIEDTVHMLRGASVFTPEKLVRDYDELWKVNLNTVYLGKVTY